MANERATKLIESVALWASGQPDVEGVLLVGSYARGNPRPDSDVDLIIVTENPSRYVARTKWFEQFGEFTDHRIEDWGALTPVRISYQSGLEVEFGIVAPFWASLNPIDPGTLRVVQDAAKILYDQTGNLRTLLAAAGASVGP